MTVGQLTELFKSLPQDLPVCVADWNEGYCNPPQEISPTTNDGHVG